MSEDFSVEGMADLERVLTEDLTRASARGSMRRSLTTAAQPLADLMAELAPDDPATSGDDLNSSITVGRKLNKREAAQHRKMFRGDRDSVEVFVGTNDAAGSKQEFGTVHHAPQPFARPAWDQDHRALLDRVAENLADQVSRAAARARRKALKG